MFAILLSLVSAAAAPDTWRTSDAQEFALVYAKSLDAFVSPESCVDAKCGAAQLLEQARHLPKDEAAPKNNGGKNPAGEICKRLGAKPLMLRNERGSESLFCQAKDLSVISGSALANAK